MRGDLPRMDDATLERSMNQAFDEISSAETAVRNSDLLRLGFAVARLRELAYPVLHELTYRAHERQRITDATAAAENAGRGCP